MKKNYFFLLLLSLSLLPNVQVSAQIVGTDCFLQGQWLEVGINRMGGFGTCSSPATYHPHLCCGTGTAFTPGGALDAAYDWGHDGWSAGMPQLMGNYTQPGFPQEGWSVQIGATEYRNGAWGGLCTGATAIAGSITGYTNVGGRATGTWSGGVAGMNIIQETVVDTYSSWAVITTRLYNTTAAPMTNVFYERTCDPDNVSYWSGGSTTRQVIVHQNEDARHLVQVSAYGDRPASGSTPAYDSINSYLGYAARDCRARVGEISGLSPSGSNPQALWNGAGPAGPTAPVTLSVLGTTSLRDRGIFIVFNIGTIAPGDSAVVSYAYIYNGNYGLDSALPNPQLVLNGVPRVSLAPPAPNFDTFDVCANPGMISLPVDILHGGSTSWTYSKWTWAPSTGLSATTGLHVNISTTVLPPSITYTITGVDTSAGLGSCLSKTFYLTILTCNGAEANSPCAGDTLWFNAPGDSTAATYQWIGPAPSTSVFATTQKAFKYPATDADNGMYMVIKTTPSGSDTAYTPAIVHHKPTVWASSNSPLCIGAANTLLLTSVCDSPGVTYSWTANPPPFTSTLANPSIVGFTESDTGMYQVVVTSVFGCSDTDQTHVVLAPVPDPPTVVAASPYCQDDTFIPFTISGIVPGGSALWYPSYTGGVGVTTTPTVNTAVPGVNTYYFSQIIGSCEGPRDSVVVLVNPKPAAIVGPMGLCQYFTTTLSSPTPGGVWSSSNPAIATVDASTAVVSGLNAGTVLISYTLPTTCRRTTVVTVHPKPAPPVVLPHRECQFTIPTTASATGTNLTWYGLGVTAGTPLAPVPNTDTVPGIYNYYVTQTSAFGCISDSAVYPVRIVPEPTPPMVVDTVYCQNFDAPRLTAVGSNLLWYTTPTSTPGSSTAPKPNTDNPGITGYYVTQTVDQCESPKAELNVTVLVLPDFKITPDRPWLCQFDSIGLEFDGATLVDPAYHWELPEGAYFVDGTTMSDERVFVKFDKALGKHTVRLTATNYKGRCSADAEVDIKVVPAPDAHAYVMPDVCLGDTINMAISSRSDNSYKFVWNVNGIPLSASKDIDIVSYNSNSGGPYVVSFPKKGLHIINIQGFTVEGCKSLITADTVLVHELPDARFDFVTDSKRLCIEDSVLFIARTQDYANNYKWEPEHFFVNQNKPKISGRVELSSSMVRLTVTDPFGCQSSYVRQINPDQCCTVQFPNAFSPNGDDLNDFFRPVFAGYHRFHIFRVSNRWGQTVFESANSNPRWDGTYNGIPQDMGTYFYYIKYDCGGKTLEAKGDITLIR